MQGNAHISFAGGGLILPAQTPYDRELVFEHIEASAKQHARIELSAKGRHWTISLKSAHRELCARCSRSLRDLTYRGNGKNFCGHCVRHALM
jgi:hypothetical protein